MISDVFFQTWGHLSAHPALKYMYMFCVGSIGAALEVVGRSTVVTVGLVRGPPGEIIGARTTPFGLSPKVEVEKRRS